MKFFDSWTATGKFMVIFISIKNVLRMKASMDIVKFCKETFRLLRALTVADSGESPQGSDPAFFLKGVVFKI